jgi:hypothetical protein
MTSDRTQPQPVEPHRVVLECESREPHPAHTWLILVTRWDAERVSRYWCPGMDLVWAMPDDPLQVP